MFHRIKPTSAEVARSLAGDDIVPNADIVMDRALTLPATPEEVWPWILQLGKNRAGWYFPRRIEWFIIPSKRGLRRLDTQFQNLQVGSVIDDWGGRDATFEVVSIDAPHELVYKSQRGKMFISWAIVLTPDAGDTTRIHFRLRLAPVRRKALATFGGGFIDALTIAGLAAGLRERLES